MTTKHWTQYKGKATIHENSEKFLKRFSKTK
jgi:hypothetical protein